MPAAIPAALKLVRGTYNVTRERERSDVRVAGKIEPLATLTEAEQKHFDFFVRHAIAGAHGAIDSLLFTQIARTAAKLDAAEEKTARFGMVMKSPVSGKPEVQPYMKIATDLRMQLLRLLSDAGLTPVGRARLGGGVKTPQPESGWDDID